MGETKRIGASFKAEFGGGGNISARLAEENALKALQLRRETAEDRAIVEEIESSLSATVAETKAATQEAIHAVDSIQRAVDAADRAEAFTKGTVDDEPVAEGEVGYEDNALYYAQKAKESADMAVEAIDLNADTIANIQAAMNNYVEDAYTDEEGYLYMTHGGEVIVGPLGPFNGGGGGGGGGGSGNAATMTMANTMDWLAKTISVGSPIVISFRWSSLENENSTGPGTMRVTVNGEVKRMSSVQQGNVTVEVTDFLSTGRNTISIQVSDVYENTRRINYTVNAVALSVSSTFDPTEIRSGEFTFPYTPVGAVAKTVHILVDGEEIATTLTSVSNRQLTQVIPAQSHGAHSLECYFTATIEGDEAESNHLRYEFIVVDSSGESSVISIDFNQTSVLQYDTVAIPFTVYTPNSLTTPIAIELNGEVISEQVVDRTPQSFSYRFMEAGEVELKIITDTATRSVEFTVDEVEIESIAETDALALWLTSSGRSNNEQNPNVWKNAGVEAVMNNFNFVSDGWLPDKDGATVLRVSGNATVYIPYRIFENDFRNTGKTIELEFATHNVTNYDTPMISCMSGGRGIMVTPQSCQMISEQTTIGTQYKEDEHVRIAFVVEKRTENRLISCYINGIISGTMQYATTDDFAQADPVGITIGNRLCDVDIYNIRVYDNNLSKEQVMNNWIADTQSVTLMMERWNRNNIYDAYGNITIDQLPNDLPYMVLECAELPQYKGDKKTVTGRYVDPSNSLMSFTFVNCQADVQGTSSQYYARKNYKLKFNGGFDMSNGTHASKYAFTAGAKPVKTFCMKADVASSEGANNVELVRLYCAACPYKTPAQVLDETVRQGIDGFPIVIFWKNTTTDETSFLGKVMLK